MRRLRKSAAPEIIQKGIGARHLHVALSEVHRKPCEGLRPLDPQTGDRERSMDDATKQMLLLLQDMKPINLSKDKTSLEIKISNITFIMKIISFALFGVLLIIYFYANFNAPSIYLKYVALISGVLSIALIAVWMALDVIPVFALLIRFRDYEKRTFLMEADHDAAYASTLSGYDKDVLEAAMRIINIKIERLRSRMVVFLGGQDKVAAMAIVVAALSAIKDSALYMSLLHNEVFVYGSAFVVGIAGGGMLLSHIFGRYCYQRDILSLALAEKARCENCQGQ